MSFQCLNCTALAPVPIISKGWAQVSVNGQHGGISGCVCSVACLNAVGAAIKAAAATELNLAAQGTVTGVKLK